jgi:small-conductance mechanosensitive channel
MIAEVWGREKLAEYLFISFLHSTVVIIVFTLVTYFIRGGFEWLFNRYSRSRITMLHSNADAIISQVTLFISIAIWGIVVLPGILVIWGIYLTLAEATTGLLTFGFSVGSQRISVSLVLIAAAIIYGSFLISWIIQRVLMEQELLTRKVEMGVRHSIGRLIHYALIVIGFILAISVLGFSITNLTIILSALGVGIGFGLQGVVNNFICGLILLFERPVRVGDMVVLNGTWAEIKKIGLRATTIQSFDSSDVIIPNADLISNPVTNWELSNRRRRIDIPVGVAYGSDIPLVIKTLIGCASGNTMLAESPAPQVLFLSFGESSLAFELRVFVSDVRNSMTVISELHQQIDRRFREAKIEIAFPQRDLHLRSVDESITLRSPETGK